ncbi:Hypothetical protein NTJ_09993 [Nesidiocoris tenuis]|uniref:Uncharacterized protein n=1 Tax=Nesidiocoris tenuis TaxID=355587 RepID=A0ABN7AYB9_9HEMI|nr:Hypothetical protein NTJ_09993 [Nesidiocoris tenuis]
MLQDKYVLAPEVWQTPAAIDLTRKACPTPKVTDSAISTSDWLQQKSMPDSTSRDSIRIVLYQLLKLDPT